MSTALSDAHPWEAVQTLSPLGRISGSLPWAPTTVGSPALVTSITGYVPVFCPIDHHHAGEGEELGEEGVCRRTVIMKKS